MMTTVASQESSEIDPHKNQVQQYLESFKDAYSRKDYGVCTHLLSRLNGILIEKKSQGRVDLSKTVAGSKEQGQKLDDFSKIPLDKEYLHKYPFGDMTMVGFGYLDDVLTSEVNNDEQLEQIQENFKRIPTPTARMLHGLEQQLDSEEEE